MKSKTNKFKDILDNHPLATLIAVIISTAGITYVFTNNMILNHYKLKIDRQVETIAIKDDSITLIKTNRSLLEEDIIKLKETIETLHHALEKCKGKPVQVDPRISKLSSLIRHGSNLKNKNVNENTTQVEFTEWRKKCINLIASFDNTENHLNNFREKTNLRDDNYTTMPSMINDGIDLLEELKGSLRKN